MPARDVGLWFECEVAEQGPFERFGTMRFRKDVGSVHDFAVGKSVLDVVLVEP